MVLVTYQWDERDKIERVKLSDVSYLTDSEANQLAQDIAGFAVDEGISLVSVGDVRRNEWAMTIAAESWQKDPVVAG